MAESLILLFYPIQQLHFVEDPTLTTESGESVAGRIQVLMKDIEKDINSTGNLINKVGYGLRQLVCLPHSALCHTS
jgi:hypothetical protein